MTQDEKIRENRLRRMAKRQGLALRKSRRRDPNALTFATYQIIEPRRNLLFLGSQNGGYGETLDSIEAWLTDQERSQRGEELYSAEVGRVYPRLGVEKPTRDR
jgi:hypothetical protein